MEKRETREERDARHARKAATVQAHRSKIKAQLSRQVTSSKLKGPSQFHCPLRFDNTLPEVPVEPKLLPHPYDTDAPFEYNIRRQPVLETTYTFPLHAELDIGGPIDILDPESYAMPTARGPLDPLDELITDPKLAVSSAKKKAWAVDLETEVEWILAPDVIMKDGNDISIAPSLAHARAAPKPIPRRAGALQHTAATRAERILQSFDACRDDAPVVNPKNPALAPVRQWVVLPDTNLSQMALTLVTFDVDPNDKVERKKRKSKADLDAASTKRRLASGLIASPAGAPPTVAGGRLGRFYLPDPDAADVSAIPAVVQHVRDYNLAIDVFKKQQAMENFVLVLDNAQYTASLAPLKAHAEMTKIKKQPGVVPAYALSRTREVAAVARTSTQSSDSDSDSSVYPPPPPPPPSYDSGDESDE